MAVVVAAVVAGAAFPVGAVEVVGTVAAGAAVDAAVDAADIVDAAEVVAAADVAAADVAADGVAAAAEAVLGLQFQDSDIRVHSRAALQVPVDYKDGLARVEPVYVFDYKAAASAGKAVASQSAEY